MSHDGDRLAGLARRREHGIAAYARIFDVPPEDVPAAMASRVGRGSQAMEAVHRIAGPHPGAAAPVTP